MGIRKHFEKKGEGDLKLSDLSLEQEETEKLKFDSETEITESDWQKMKQELEEYRENNGWHGFLNIGSCLKILCPDKLDELNINDQERQKIKQLLEKFRKVGLEDKPRGPFYRKDDWRNFAFFASCAKIIQPDKFDKLDIDDQDWQKMKHALEDYKKSAWSDFIHLATSMKILQPDKFDELNINDQDWQKMKQELEECRENNRWGGFAWLAMHLRILQPNKFADVRISKQAWWEMRQELEKYWKVNNWSSFSQQAKYMKIMTADEVKVTDQGLKITMLPPGSFKTPKKPRPERKNF